MHIDSAYPTPHLKKCHIITTTNKQIVVSKQKKVFREHKDTAKDNSIILICAVMTIYRVPSEKQNCWGKEDVSE